MLGLSRAELAILKPLNTPVKIQDFLDRLPINFESAGETLMSPRRALSARRAHCFEGALIAATALWLQGRPPLLMDFKTVPTDEEHVVALFKEDGYWGAISKTNHPLLRYRDAIYRTPRELALSYFHEYFDFTTGAKTLRAFSLPFDLRRWGSDWVIASDDLWWLDRALDRSPHVKILSPRQRRMLRPVGRLEIKAGRQVEWPNKH